MATNKKILMVATDFPYTSKDGFVVQGGGGACVSQLVGGLIKDGYDITLVTSVAKDIVEEAYDIPIHRTPFKNIMGIRESKITHYWSATKKCKELLKTEDFDIIHTHNPLAGLTGNKVSNIGTSKIPHILTMHGSWAGVRQKWYTKKFASVIEKKAVKGADFVTCDSLALKDEMSKYRTENISTITNAIDSNKFQRLPKEFASNKLGIDPYSPKVLYTGRFVAEKGLPYLLEAFRDVTRAQLLMVGGGFDKHLVQDWMYANKEESLRMTTLPYLAYGEMPLVYSASDIFVLPSLSEGFSRSIMEAMAIGLPVIATNVGGNPELVGDCGILVPPKDPKAIAEAINRLLEDPKERERIGKKGQKKALATLSVEQRVKGFEELYDTIHP